MIVYSTVRFAPVKPPQIQLTPIHFEVPHQESSPMFIGREWVYKEMEQVLYIILLRIDFQC